MSLKLFQETNLINYVTVAPIVTTPGADQTSITPSISGSHFTKLLTGTGDKNQSANLGGISTFFITTQGLIIHAELNLSQIPIIPPNSVITNLRIGFDYNISFNASGHAPGGLTNGGAQGQLTIQLTNGDILVDGVVLTTVQFPSSPLISIGTSSPSISYASGSLSFEYDPTILIFYADFVNTYNLPGIIIESIGSGITAGWGQSFNPAVSTSHVDFSINISNWFMQVTYSDNPNLLLEITGSGGLAFSGNGYGIYYFVGGDSGSDFNGNNGILLSGGGSDYIVFNEITGSGGLLISGGGLIQVTDIVGSGGINMSNVNEIPVILSVDVSGIYQLTPGLKHDTLYNRINLLETTTTDVAIPSPYVRTAFMGG